MIHKKNFSQQGQTLLEVLIAVGVAIIIIAALTVAVTSALYNARFSKNQTLAQQAAQQGMEVLREMRNSNWATFSGLSGTYCLDYDFQYGEKNSVAGCDRLNSPEVVNNNLMPGSPMAREFTIKHNDTDKCPRPTSAPSSPLIGETSVTVKVTWIDGKCTTSNYCHSAQQTSCLSSPNLIPAP